MNSFLDENEKRLYEKSLYESLKNLADSKQYPLHMPGHKRNSNAGRMGNYMDIDITEIDDYDNLHDAEGIIKACEERANRLYGADETHFLINGSTCGVLAAVSASVPKGGSIIAARNVHKSFYHAAYLRELKISFVMPQNTICTREGFIDKTKENEKIIQSEKAIIAGQIMGKITPRDIEKAFEGAPSAKAVFITSPTYEGIVSDVREIADIVHRHDAILIVDEAHGAHFGLAGEYLQKEYLQKEIPDSAVHLGADIVIHSVHKTLAAMTQTALIHVTGQRADREKLRRFLRIYQSSSPSYVLMSSIDSCIKDINERGDEIFENLLKYRKKLEKETEDLKKLFIVQGGYGQDPCKVLVCSADGAVTGQQIYDILRVEYKLQCEMAGDTYALAIITGYDTDEGIERLVSAIRDIDRRLAAKDAAIRIKALEDKIGLPETVVPFYKAWDAKVEEVDISRASGRVAGDFINLYPPGIPLVIPGELIDKDLVEMLGQYINEGRNVQGVRVLENGARLVSCLTGE